jgi:hypothetical protein
LDVQGKASFSLSKKGDGSRICPLAGGTIPLENGIQTDGGMVGCSGKDLIYFSVSGDRLPFASPWIFIQIMTPAVPYKDASTGGDRFRASSMTS